MKYICSFCNYSTNDFGNWSKHKNSKKHVKNSNEHPKTTCFDSRRTLERLPKDSLKNTNKSEYVCEYCKISFAKSCNLSRHLKKCVEKKHSLLEDQFEKYKRETELVNQLKLLEEKLKNIEKEKELLQKEKIEMRENMDNLKTEMEKHIKTLKTENQFQKQLINCAGGIVQKSMNTMSYLLLNHNNAPELEALKDYSIITRDTETLIKDLIFYHKKGKFDKYIGDFIVKQYKKEDPNLQAIWSSDIERLNYFIRELINNKNNNLENKSRKQDVDKNINWIIDKKGIRVKKCIIDPLLEYINSIGVKYINEKNGEIPELETNEATVLLGNMQEMALISNGIRNKTLANNINKYIAPHFFLNKENTK